MTIPITEGKGFLKQICDRGDLPVSPQPSKVSLSKKIVTAEFESRSGKARYNGPDEATLCFCKESDAQIEDHPVVN